MYAWPLLQSLFSEVLTKEEWVKMFDNVFSNHPSFLLLAVAAYTICSHKALLQCTRKEDFEVLWKITFYVLVASKGPTSQLIFNEFPLWKVFWIPKSKNFYLWNPDSRQWNLNPDIRIQYFRENWNPLKIGIRNPRSETQYPREEWI